MNRSLMNKVLEELVPMLQEMFAELWEPLEHSKRWMEVVTKLKEIPLDDGSASSPYAALLTELVVGPNLGELRRSWTIDYPWQAKLVLFLLRLSLQLPPMQSFLEDVVKPELSKSTERFYAVWEVEPGWVWLCPWMSIIG